MTPEHELAEMLRYTERRAELRRLANELMGLRGPGRIVVIGTPNPSGSDFWERHLTAQCSQSNEESE